jgi:heterodisulfide reductase subunit A
MAKTRPGATDNKDIRASSTKKGEFVKSGSNRTKKNDRKSNGALVIGGGISGIQAALDLAEMGIKTYLVDRSTSIGGRMAQLDKTFPTNDCAMCILSPKLVAVARHANIKLLTNSEVTSISGNAGEFKVQVTKYPRFIDEDKCVGCGECATKCPKKTASEFDLGLGNRKAIYLPFPQAVPLVYAIDKENCIYLQKGKCGVCAKVCEANAVDFEQKPEKITLDIGAIIVATGYSQYNPAELEELGYSIHKNVITGLEFERLLNASGPTKGAIIRRSDEKPPKRILFVQCVGSRDKHRAREYCSRICCMYAIKEALIAKEHQSTLTDLTILGIEIRAYGKGFEEYYQRAIAEGINFVKGRPARIAEDPKTGEVNVQVEDVESGEIKELTTDLVVLSSAVIPNDTNKQLSNILGIELDDQGFFKESTLPGTASESSRSGILLSGCAQGPKDIPDSVAQGSAAATKAAEYLIDSKVKIEDVQDHIKDTKDLSLTNQIIDYTEPRIGVFVCHCGINIAGVLDVPTLVKFSKTLPQVVFTTDNLYTCSDDAQRYIQDMIKEHSLTRVVIASCTPRTHEPIFRETCARAGLNPYLFEMTNIRDQCSWVHMHEPESATEKAKDLISMAVARAGVLRPLEKISTPINQSVLVVGGGISGIQCATDLANQGIKTYIVEKNPELGGRLIDLNKLANSDITIKELLNSKIDSLKSAGVKIFTGYKIVDIQGYVGNFEINLKRADSKDISINKTKNDQPAKLIPVLDKEKDKRLLTKDQINLNVGSIVIAIGADLYEPGLKGEFGFGKYSNVLSNLEFEKIMKEKESDISSKNIVFIQCVGSREHDKKDGNTSCSRYCCQTTLHQALEAKLTGAAVTVLHRGIRAFSKYAEELYYEASNQGVRFVQFPDGMDNAPIVSNKGSKIRVFDISISREIDIKPDIIVLALAMVPEQNETEQLQKWLKIPRSGDGFFLELHPKLAPVETNTVGIYICGCAQGPKDVIDSLSQASAAAAKVAALVSNDELTVEPITAQVNESVCWGCGTCEELCAFGAARLDEGADGIQVSIVNPALCKGCGVCASNCPSGAMSIHHFSNEQIESMIKAFGEVTV